MGHEGVAVLAGREFRLLDLLDIVLHALAAGILV
jgi:hypothetical protein